MKAATMYDGFIAFEERSASLYLDMSAHFFSNPELSWFWVEMAMEEKQHAGMLQFCRDAHVFAADLPGKHSIQNLRRLFADLEKKARQGTLTMDEAFQIAATLEKSEINDIYSRLTAPITGPAHIMAKKMELSVDNHFERLCKAAERFGVDLPVERQSTPADFPAALAAFSFPGIGFFNPDTFAKAADTVLLLLLLLFGTILIAHGVIDLVRYLRKINHGHG